MEDGASEDDQWLLCTFDIMLASLMMMGLAVAPYNEKNKINVYTRDSSRSAKTVCLLCCCPHVGPANAATNRKI